MRSRHSLYARHLRTRRQRVVGNLLTLGLVAICLAVGWLLFGAQIVRFVTGQDIYERVAADVEARRSLFAPVALRADDRPDQPTGDEIGRGVAQPNTGPTFEPDRKYHHVFKYTVQPGDTVFGIAEKFSIAPETVFWANTETLQDNVHLIYVGVPLYILPIDGVYHTADGKQTIAEIADEYGVEPSDILLSPYNRLGDHDADWVAPQGLRIVVPGGEREFIAWRAPIVTGTQTTTSPEAPIHPGSCRGHYTGMGGTGTFMNPLGNIPYRVTTGFYPWHPAVDLSSNTGDPVLASDSGIVVFAGRYNGGYGELVIIDHGNGFTTYYAHLQSRFVECGQQVNQGQPIGTVGATGNASGSHLHFEIRQNDIGVNPYHYIPIQDMRTGSAPPVAGSPSPSDTQPPSQ
jgi:murein DD-endopeptidase MepM/ murein hydrolase activator NlpD